MKYTVKIIETLSKEVEVDTNTPDDAIEEVQKMYKNQDIVLSADDFIQVDFIIKNK